LLIAIALDAAFGQKARREGRSDIGQALCQRTMQRAVVEFGQQSTRRRVYHLDAAFSIGHDNAIGHAFQHRLQRIFFRFETTIGLRQVAFRTRHALIKNFV
jgi:hypothetical protein